MKTDPTAEQSSVHQTHDGAGVAAVATCSPSLGITGGMERHIRALEAIIEDVAELLSSIMRDEVNHQDEAEKWLRAYAPQHLFPENTATMASAGLPSVPGSAPRISD